MKKHSGRVTNLCEKESKRTLQSDELKTSKQNIHDRKWKKKSHGEIRKEWWDEETMYEKSNIHDIIFEWGY